MSFNNLKFIIKGYKISIKLDIKYIYYFLKIKTKNKINFIYEMWINILIYIQYIHIKKIYIYQSWFIQRKIVKQINLY